jgi:thiosulfate/3-mercaptopyruvate sulfurtransferase
MTHAIQVPGPLVETEWLAKHQKEVVVLDVRNDTGSFTKKPVFKRDSKTGGKKLAAVGGHIPGASLVNYKRVRAKRKIDGQLVTRQIPMRTDFEKLMQQSGVNRDSAIVIVSKGQDTSDLTMATRLYWSLKYYGHDNMGILNGGMAQWINDDRPIVINDHKPKRGNWQAGEKRRELLATTDDVATAMKSGSVQLVDNRPLSQYMGVWKKSYVYEKGHIPGAKLFSTELMSKPEMPAKFLPTGDLRALIQGMNIKEGAETITYCNSGHLASGGWFVMSELLGNKNTRLYDGSMHEWTLKKQPVSALKME